MLASAMQAMHLTLPSLVVHAQLVVQVRIRLLQAISHVRHAQPTTLGAEVRAQVTVMQVLALRTLERPAHLVLQVRIRL